MNSQTAVSAVKRPNSVAVGTIVWLGSELMFFAGLFAIYFTLRAMNPDLWVEQVEKHKFMFALVNTIILVLSSFTAQFGVWAAERMQPYATGRSPKSWGAVEWFYLTVILGAVFVAGQVWEYANFVSEGITFDGDPYGTAFYFTTGFHGIHVTLGLVAFLLIIGRMYAVKNFSHREETSALVVSYYWHFVDIVWIALFIVIYVVK